MPTFGAFIGALLVSSLALATPAVSTAQATTTAPNAFGAEAATWEQCGFTDKQSKKVRTFGRAPAPGLGAGNATLVCGYQG